MKNLLFLAGIICSITFFNSCAPGYVQSIPNEQYYSRPIQPTSSHVWVDGNWVYRRNAKAYYRNSGTWVTPPRNKSYYQGTWRSNKHGYRWHNGQWR